MADAADVPLEDQKKLIVPFMQRAQEVDKVDPKIAYYCRLHAVEQAVSIPRRAKEVNALVGAVISKLEKDKASLALDKSQDRWHCEAFALRVFANADRADRAGRRDDGTAKAFYAASCFLDILNQFGSLDAELIAKQKYALWRAAEIRKAAREGRPPVPPPADDQAPAGELGGGVESSYLSSEAVATASMAGLRTLDEPIAPSPPPPPGPPPPPEPMSRPSPLWEPAPPSGPPVQLGQRYKPGCPVFFCASAGVGTATPQEIGSIGQVIANPDGTFKYRVALRDRIETASDMQVAPCPPEGAPVTFVPGPGGIPMPATLRLANDGMGWPPTYLIALPDGTEVVAEAHQLSMLNLEDTVQALGLVVPSGGDTPNMESFVSVQPPPSPPPSSPASNVQGPGSPRAAASRSGSLVNAHPPQYPPPNVPGLSPLRDASSWQDGVSGSGSGWPAQPPAPSAPLPPLPPPPVHVSAPVAPLPPPPPAVHPPPVAAHPPPPPAATAPQQQRAVLTAAGGITLPALQPGHKPTVHAIAEAQKAARTAVSSLNFEDVTSAVKYLTHAIDVLTTPPGAPLRKL